MIYAFAAVRLTLLVSGINPTPAGHWQETLYKPDLKISLKMSQVDYRSLENPDTYRLFRSLGEAEDLESGFNRIANVFQPAIKGVFRATRADPDKSRAFTNRLLYYTDNYVNGYTAGKDIRLYGQKELIHQELSGLVRQKNRDNDRCENQSIGYQGTGVVSTAC